MALRLMRSGLSDALRRTLRKPSSSSSASSSASAMMASTEASPILHRSVHTGSRNTARSSPIRGEWAVLLGDAVIQCRHTHHTFALTALLAGVAWQCVPCLLAQTLAPTRDFVRALARTLCVQVLSSPHGCVRQRKRAESILPQLSTVARRRRRAPWRSVVEWTT